jgi:hypothetical protein
MIRILLEGGNREAENEAGISESIQSYNLLPAYPYFV